MGPIEVPQLNLASGTISDEQQSFFDVDDADKLSAG